MAASALAVHTTAAHAHAQAAPTQRATAGSRPASVAPASQRARPRFHHPPPPPPVRLHDGFYFRFGLGPGLFYDKITSSVVDGASFFGFALTGELLFGGTPAEGLVIGGGTHGASVFAPSLTVDGSDAEGPDLMDLSVIGAFLDYYPDPARGLHVQGLLGFSILGADGSTFGDNPLGFAIAAGVGYEWWVGEEWSLGLLGRMIVAPMFFSDGSIDEQHFVLVPGALATFTYH